MDKKTNLYDPAKSKQKGIDNEHKILQFLLKEKYSTSPILTSILGYKDRSSVLKILRRLEKKELIRKHKIDIFRTLYGITNNGLHVAQSDQDKITDWQYFEPSKVNPITLDHQLGIQKIHAICLKLGLYFMPGRELGSRADSDKISDGVINIFGNKIALEMERHVKSRRRYDAVIYNYLKLVKTGEYQSILYVSDTAEKTERIKKAIHSLDKITMKVNGRNKDLKINPEVHFSYFDFIALDDVETYLSELKEYYGNKGTNRTTT